MGFMKCRDVAEMVTDEATKQFAPLLAEDGGRKQELKEYCGVIDEIAERFGGASYEAEVDRETTDITISLVCGELETSAASDGLYRLMRSAKKASFRPCGEEQLRIDLTFGGIWVQA